MAIDTRPATTSRWRDIARRILDELMPRLRACQDRKAARAMMNRAYPFGQRKMLPYRMWCLEVRLALDLLFPPEKPALNSVSFVINGNWFLNVRCTWCNRLVRGAQVHLRFDCLMCARKCAEAWALVDSAEWKVWKAAMIEDRRAALVFADWLDDRGQGELAAVFRAEVEKADSTIHKEKEKR